MLRSPVNVMFVGGKMDGRTQAFEADTPIQIGALATKQRGVVYVMAYEVRSPDGRTQLMVPVTKNPLRSFLYKRRAKGIARHMVAELNALDA